MSRIQEILRFNCPHCHASVDPASMDSASSDLADYRICPVCDEAVVVGMRSGSPVSMTEVSGATVRRDPRGDEMASSRVLP